ncbi:hypothetical protein GW17_00056811 [Ensete ventricosum]|nr:hypothetical protein GW17_00056811 [Ensete ventricosum]
MGATLSIEPWVRPFAKRCFRRFLRSRSTGTMTVSATPKVTDVIFGRARLDCRVAEVAIRTVLGLTCRGRLVGTMWPSTWRVRVARRTRKGDGCWLTVAAPEEKVMPVTGESKTLRCAPSPSSFHAKGAAGGAPCDPPPTSAVIGGVNKGTPPSTARSTSKGPPNDGTMKASTSAALPAPLVG